jgi:hypothetical protein
MIIQAFAPLAIATPDPAAEPLATPIALHRGIAWDRQPARSRLRSNTQQRRYRNPHTGHRPPSPHELALIRDSDTSKDNPIPAISTAKSSGTPFALVRGSGHHVEAWCKGVGPPCAGGDAAGQSWAQRADARDVVTRVTSAEERRKRGEPSLGRRCAKSPTALACRSTRAVLRRRRCGPPPRNCGGSSVAARLKMRHSTGMPSVLHSTRPTERSSTCTYRASSRDRSSANSGPSGTVTRFAIA